MRVLAIIPARKGSKRLPGKNGMRLGGKTLVELAVECANQCEFVESVCVSSDDKRLGEDTNAHNLDRPPWLAGDKATTEATVIDAICQMWRRTGKRYDAVMVLQPTSPLRRPEHLTACCDLLDGWDSVVSVTEIKHPPHKTCIVRNDGSLHVPGSGQGWDGWRRDGVCYLTRIDTAANGDLYGKNVRPFYTPAPCGISIDTQEDWEDVQRLWSKQNEEFKASA